MTSGPRHILLLNPLQRRLAQLFDYFDRREVATLLWVVLGGFNSYLLVTAIACVLVLSF